MKKIYDSPKRKKQSNQPEVAKRINLQIFSISLHIFGFNGPKNDGSIRSFVKQMVRDKTAKPSS